MLCGLCEETAAKEDMKRTKRNGIEKKDGRTRGKAMTVIEQTQKRNYQTNLGLRKKFGASLSSVEDL